MEVATINPEDQIIQPKLIVIKFLRNTYYKAITCDL
jgi:hypothetical protein